MSKELDKQRLAIRAKLAALGGEVFHDEDVVFEGTKFILPKKYEPDLSGPIKALREKREADEEPTEFKRNYAFRPYDGAYAAYNVMKRLFGIVAGQPTMTMFGPKPPELVDIEVAPGERDQVPWGALSVPLWEDTLVYVGAVDDPKRGPVFQLRVIGPRKYRYEIEGLFMAVEEQLQLHSIYRGQAFDTDGNFLDLASVKQDEIVYSNQLRGDLETYIWLPVEHTEVALAEGLALKRSILLEGPYGSGKTTIGFDTAVRAVQHGWTFILAAPGKMKEALQTALLYGPAVMFVEDTDTFASADQSASAVSELLDNFDGIKAKNTRLVAVLTTNHVSKIHAGMVRPGRLDAVIHVGPPEKDGVEAMIRRFIEPAKLSADFDINQVFTAMDGYTNAFVREALVLAAGGPLRAQWQLMHDAKDHADYEEPVGRALARVIRNTVRAELVPQIVGRAATIDEIPLDEE